MYKSFWFSALPHLIVTKKEIWSSIQTETPGTFGREELTTVIAGLPTRNVQMAPLSFPFSSAAAPVSIYNVSIICANERLLSPLRSMQAVKPRSGDQRILYSPGFHAPCLRFPCLLTLVFQAATSLPRLRCRLNPGTRPTLATTITNCRPDCTYYD